MSTIDVVADIIGQLAKSISRMQEELDAIKSQLKAQPGVAIPSEADKQLEEIEAEISGRRQTP